VQTYFGDATIYNQILNNSQVSYDMRLSRGMARWLSAGFQSIALKGSLLNVLPRPL
jgi:hypothetical protein